MANLMDTHPEAAVDKLSYGSPPEKVDESFRGVTKSLAELEQKGLNKYLPNSFVFMTILPFKRHVAEVRVTGGKAPSEEVDLMVYYAVFKGFGELYEMTDSALESVGTIDGTIKYA